MLAMVLAAVKAKEWKSGHVSRNRRWALPGGFRVIDFSLCNCIHSASTVSPSCPITSASTWRTTAPLEQRHVRSNA